MCVRCLGISFFCGVYTGNLCVFSLCSGLCVLCVFVWCVACLCVVLFVESVCRCVLCMCEKCSFCVCLICMVCCVFVCFVVCECQCVLVFNYFFLCCVLCPFVVCSLVVFSEVGVFVSVDCGVV